MTENLETGARVHDELEPAPGGCANPRGSMIRTAASGYP